MKSITVHFPRHSELYPPFDPVHTHAETAKKNVH